MDFDKTKHLADKAIRKREEERQKLIQLEQEREDRVRKEREAEEQRREDEKGMSSTLSLVPFILSHSLETLIVMVHCNVQHFSNIQNIN